MYEVTIKSHFSGAHFLREYQGRCENLHGHNWTVEVTLQGEQLSEIGMLYDFKELKKILHEIIDELDHSLLNDHPEFQKINPSAESIARFIYNRLAKVITTPLVTVKQVCVHESENSYAVYRKQ
jgi:6-pyruvoyltetrahydropterin/6-carboxytetrahydropterin synthase